MTESGAKTPAGGDGRRYTGRADSKAIEVKAVRRRLEAERWAVLEFVTDELNLLHRLLPPRDDDSSPMLASIDWYGHTVFNSIQMKRSLAEWEYVIRRTAKTVIESSRRPVASGRRPRRQPVRTSNYCEDATGYDAEGNQTEPRGFVFQYDAEYRLISPNMLGATYGSA